VGLSLWLHNKYTELDVLCTPSTEFYQTPAPFFLSFFLFPFSFFLFIFNIGPPPKYVWSPPSNLRGRNVRRPSPVIACFHPPGTGEPVKGGGITGRKVTDAPVEFER
jgi:hypothetical protein